MMYSLVQNTWSDQSFRSASLTGSAAAPSDPMNGSFHIRAVGCSVHLRVLRWCPKTSNSLTLGPKADGVNLEERKLNADLLRPRINGMPHPSFDKALGVVAALRDPTRRRLYSYVEHQPVAVSRDEAAREVRI